MVNIGNLMARWSAGYYRSSIHRVVANPVGKHVEEDRWSVICFMSPKDSYDMVLVPSCVEQVPEERRKDLAVGINCGAYMDCKLTQLFDPLARDDKGKCVFDD